jgi:hypothetical protein
MSWFLKTRRKGGTVLGDVNILIFKHVHRHPLERARDVHQDMPGIAERTR